MKAELAIIIAVFGSTIGLIAPLCVRTFEPCDEEKKKKMKWPVIKKISWLLFSIGLFIFISFIASLNGEHLNSKISYEEYPIEKLTEQLVYFGEEKQNLTERWTLIEKPQEKYENIVLVEKENYSFKWLFWKVNNTSNTYHVYLSNDVYETYEQLKDNVIYERIQEK